jgi:hypothetical protein
MSLKPINSFDRVGFLNFASGGKSRMLPYPPRIHHTAFESSAHNANTRCVNLNSSEFENTKRFLNNCFGTRGLRPISLRYLNAALSSSLEHAEAGATTSTVSPRFSGSHFRDIKKLCPKRCLLKIGKELRHSQRKGAPHLLRDVFLISNRTGSGKGAAHLLAFFGAEQWGWIFVIEARRAKALALVDRSVQTVKR